MWSVVDLFPQGVFCQNKGMDIKSPCPLGKALQVPPPPGSLTDPLPPIRPGYVTLL